ncbi:MAG: hypothetical protein CM15mP12_1510 [Gammaproteobacteria bacterium]|nr:MAG: hypothetical protein CM15mP12_1510 [Gammaproteobacteria bacterium]
MLNNLFPRKYERCQDILNFAKDHNLKLLPSGGRTGLVEAPLQFVKKSW